MPRWPLFLRIAAVAAPALLIAHGAGWWLLSRQVAAGWDAWVEAERAQGVSVSGGARTFTGWPLAGGVEVPDISVAGPGWRWTSGLVGVTVRPWALGRLRVEPHGRQTLTAGALAATGEARAALLTVALPLGDEPVLELSGLALETPFGPVAVGHVEGRLHAGDATELGLSLREVELPPGPAYLLGRSVAGASLEASLPGPAPAPRAPDLAAWRDAGGVARIDAARLQWGALTADASGTASLDRSLQPLADLRVALTGQDAALDQAVARGLIQARAATAVRAVLTLLARASPAPGSPAGALPVSVRDGTVSLAGFPVARFPAVAWPDR